MKENLGKKQLKNDPRIKKRKEMLKKEKVNE